MHACQCLAIGLEGFLAQGIVPPTIKMGFPALTKAIKVTPLTHTQACPEAHIPGGLDPVNNSCRQCPSFWIMWHNWQSLGAFLQRSGRISRESIQLWELLCWKTLTGSSSAFHSCSKLCSEPSSLISVGHMYVEIYLFYISYHSGIFFFFQCLPSRSSGSCCLSQ